MKQLAEIEKNSREVIRVTEQEYKGVDLVDIRVYYKDKDENYKPGRKGISLPKKIMPEIVEVLKGVLNGK